MELRLSSIIHGAFGCAIGFLYVFLSQQISANFQRIYANQGLGLVDNSIMWFLGLFGMLLPGVIGGVLSIKTKNPTHGFVFVLGFALACLISMLTFEYNFGLYGFFAGMLVFALSVMPKNNKEVKWFHYPYFMAFGFLAAWVNLRLILHFFDVFTYLMFVYLHLLALILCGVRVREWGWIYVAGWCLACVVGFFALEWFYSLYLFVVPQFLLWAVLIYHKKIWKPASKDIRKEPE